MYHCHIHFYLMGQERSAFEIVKEMSPLGHFSHEFLESSQPSADLAAKADVILADIRGMNAKQALKPLISAKGQDAQFILLADPEQLLSLEHFYSQIQDIWKMPLSENELRFYFLRWQETYKMSKDYWQTNHYLEAAINNSPSLIWFKDKNGIHKKVNDSFCQTVHKPRERVEGQGHASIWDVEADDPACIESERIVMEKKETCVSNEVIQTGDGTRLLTTYKSPLFNLDGSVMGTVGVAIDVTQERAYEQEIIQKNHTLETIFTTLDCGVMRHTMDGSKLLGINNAALKILGYESKEALMAEGFDMIAGSVMEKDRKKLVDSIKVLTKENDSVSVEYRVQHKNGDIIHVMGNVKLVKEHGRLVCQRFLLDCTAQKLEEKKRAQHQAELIQALGIDYSFVCFFDLDTGMGTPLRTDGAHKEMFDNIFTKKASLTESMEQFIGQFVHEDDRETMRQAASLESLKKRLTDHKLHYVNYRTVLDGQIRYFQMKVVRAGTWDGSRGLVIGFRSVDDEIRKEMEKKHLLEDALSQANRASKAKSIFLSNMSHDIRTPMNAIVGFTNLAITHIDRKEQVEEYLKKIMASGNHLLSLINDILDMSRIESGKIHLEEKPCSLPDILHGLRNILQADIRAKQMDLFIDTVNVLDEQIYCDKLRLNQVLLNLMSNSVKYTPNGGSVSLRIIEKNNASSGHATYEFHIKDTGMGMSKEFVEHIFEPFERESNTSTSGIQGTGLGMAITKNIVDMMNGSIQVESEQGVGTEFLVSFTFRLVPETKTPQVIPELKNCRALIVDDDFNTCDSVSYMMQQIGMRAEWTLSGKEAVLRTRQAVMRKDSYGVYIVDWLLPDMNGVEVTRRIQKETGGNVPVIVMTAYDWSDIEEEAREAGVTAFCSKPLFLSELRSCLQSVIKSDQPKNSVSSQEAEKLRTGRILLAEDTELNQEIAVAILEDAGFETEVASNGQIAVDMLANSQPGYYQLVLMDIQMPVMNGYEAAKAIRKLEQKSLASIPIIAMTANAFEEDRQMALSCGMNGHIAKPIDIKKLLDTLDHILKTFQS